VRWRASVVRNKPLVIYGEGRLVCPT
jgi:hypothetical protein